MLITKIYDEKTKTERAWFDSSMFKYTEMVEDENENKGDLFVTFNNGITYKYKDVLFDDYVLVVAGGTNMSQGIALNKYVKSKYEFEKVGEKPLSEIERELKDVLFKQSLRNTTYFISGHRDITKDEFDAFYVPAIEALIEETEDIRFVIGDCKGVDIMAQNLLVDFLEFKPEYITVYHIGDKPEFIHPKITNLVGGFDSHDEKDRAMTLASIEDVAFVRDFKKLSGTAQNILRRKSFVI